MKKIEKDSRFVAGLNDQRGVVAVVVGIVIVLLIMFVALSIDVGHICVMRNELRNAADAGSLAGARFLYNDYGTLVNVGANQIAYNAATANASEGVAVEVNWPGGNAGDVQRGHWSFTTRTFTPNDSTAPVDLWNVSWEELDLNPDFINAVRVVTRREATPAASFFAGIFGFAGFTHAAESIAYIGFSGTLRPGDADQPIAICKESIEDEDGDYNCNIGRMINSGQNVESSETGAWTSFAQEEFTGVDPCQGGTNAQEVRSLVCNEGNPDMILLGEDTATSGGEIQSAFNQLIHCWESVTGRTQPWNLTLPVIECPGNNVTTCARVVGAVNVNVVWITGAGEDPDYSEAPTQMGGWSYPANAGNTNGQERWNDFVGHFNLRNVDMSPAPYNKKSIYFLPDCTEHELVGVTGGDNYGILARIPVLVK